MIKTITIPKLSDKELQIAKPTITLTYLLRVIRKLCKLSEQQEKRITLQEEHRQSNSDNGLSNLPLHKKLSLGLYEYM